MFRLCLIALCIFKMATAIPIDNGVEGDPEIECGPDSITINVNVRNPFEGSVYVKGQFADPTCVNREDAGRKQASISIPFASCNTQRTRSLNPRGVFVRTNIVVSFHPQFITKVDRAYAIQCFYMEADKTVSQELEVSMLTTGPPQTQNVLMPNCQYDILTGGPEGAPIRYAIVGQQVYHKWTCVSETSETFCMVVHSCTVNDGAGDQVELLDTSGCAVDKYLLRNLDYPTDLMAGQETHVFKYADRPQLFFQCQISISVKEPGSQCPLPQCADPARAKRQAIIDENTLDVVASLNAFQLEDEAAEQERHVIDELNQPSHENFCISSFGFGIMIAVIASMALILAGATAFVCLKSSQQKSVA